MLCITKLIMTFFDLKSHQLVYENKALRHGIMGYWNNETANTKMQYAYATLTYTIIRVSWIFMIVNSHINIHDIRITITLLSSTHLPPWSMSDVSMCSSDKPWHGLIHYINATMTVIHTDINIQTSGSERGFLVL